MSQPKASRFSGIAPQAAQADEMVYGESRPIILDPNRGLRAKPISIADILPDPAQPRRAIPSAARVAWDGKAYAEIIQWALDRWRQIAEEELGEKLPIYLATEPPEGYKRIEVEEATTPITFKLLKLVDLANDIYLNGLNEPIHVVPMESGYRGESGERRWWAHWWLYLVTGDEKWTKINAFVRDDFSVWRQASENGARQQLNAIALARQLARLLIDIYQRDGVQFASYAEALAQSECDRAYYAQVADGDVYRVPRGWGEKIVAAMGLSHTQQLRQYRALLRLPDEIWVKGDDQSWTEGALRPHTVAVATVSGSGKPKPRELNDAEKQFSADVRSALAILRHEDRVNAKLIDGIEAFCKRMRDEGKIIEVEPKK